MMHINSGHRFVNCLVVLLLGVTCHAEDAAHGLNDESKVSRWDRFRGPNGTGYVADADLPTQWTADDYVWKTKLAGSGSSSPVVWGDRIFINSCDTNTAEMTVQCLSLKTGKQLWRKSFKSKPHRLHSRNSYASSTAAVDQDRVYVTFANPTATLLVALSHDGKKVWQRDFGRWVSAHGFSMSPLVYEDKVIFVNSQQAQRLRRGVEPGQSRILAVDSKTGKDLWSTKLTTTAACYALPCVLKLPDQKAQLVGCNTGEGFYSIDPDDGKMNWKLSAFRLRTVASTLLAGDRLIGSCGSGGGGNRLVAIKPAADRAEKVFEIARNANYVPTPVAVGNLLFSFTDSGIVSCIDLKDGTVHWRERVSAGFSGSPVATDSFVYCIDESGNVFVLEAKDKYRKVSSNALGEASRSTPAIVGNRLLLRTRNHLICVSK